MDNNQRSLSPTESSVEQNIIFFIPDVRRVLHYPHSATAEHIINIINNTMDYTSVYKNVISPDGENQLTHTIYKNDRTLFINDTCPITLNE